MDEDVMRGAAKSGTFELVRWLRAGGCPWSGWICYHAVDKGHVEVLRWVRENGCPWDAYTRAKAAAEFGYTDDFGNLVDGDDNPIPSDDEFSDDYNYLDIE